MTTQKEQCYNIFLAFILLLHLHPNINLDVWFNFKGVFSTYLYIFESLTFFFFFKDMIIFP